MSNVASLRLPSYRRHKASGQAVVTVGGRDVYLGKYRSAASKDAFKRVVAEYLLEGLPEQQAPESITVVEIIAQYQRHAKTYYRKHGVVTREYGLIVESCRFARSLHGRTPAIKFGPKALKTVRQAMIEADHSRKYINKNIDRIRRMFRWAAAEELIPASVPEALAMVPGLRKGRTPARETEPILPVDDAIVDATLLHLPEIVAHMVRLQRLTGARPAEICMLRPGDLDRTADVWLYRPATHKTEHHDKIRVIFIGPKAQEVLLPYLARSVDEYCFRPCDTVAHARAARHAARRTPLSCGNKPGSNRKRRPRRTAGDAYTTGSYRRAIHRACDRAFLHPVLSAVAAAQLSDAQRAELKQWQSQHRWAPNRLRHSAATDVRREFGLEGTAFSVMRLQNKIILVTGSTTGIGEAIARRVVDEGASVILHGRDADRGRTVAADLGDRAELIISDLSDAAAPAQTVQAAIRRFGRLDAIVNNAALVTRSNLQTTDAPLFDKIMAVNVRAPMLLIRAAHPHLKASQGCVLNIGSINAYCGEGNLLAYSISKGALMTLSRNLADVLCYDGVRVNHFNVGWVLTPNEYEGKLRDGLPKDWPKQVESQFAPSGRILKPEEIAAASVYWLSDESRPISGSVVELEQYPVIGRNPTKRGD